MEIVGLGILVKVTSQFNLIKLCLTRYFFHFLSHSMTDWLSSLFIKEKNNCFWLNHTQFDVAIRLQVKRQFSLRVDSLIYRADFYGNDI